MVKSVASAVEDYLNELPPQRRDVEPAARELILNALPRGYQESIAWEMISYSVPLERDPHTYNGQPLAYASLAAQKNGYSLYVMGPYMDPDCDRALRDGFAAAGRKLDMGKSCIRFKKIEDLPLDVIAETLARFTPDEFIAGYERSRT